MSGQEVVHVRSTIARPVGSGDDDQHQDDDRHHSAYEPLTPTQWERRMRQVAGRLLVAIDEHRDACEDEASAKADYDRAYLTAHLASLNNETKRTVSHHESWAQMQALEQKEVLNAMTARRKSLDQEMHSLRQILHTLNTNARVMGHVT